MKPITLPPSPPGSDPAAQFAWIRACLQTIERASQEEPAQIFDRIARGRTAKETGTLIRITKRTVEAHIASAVVKLGASNRIHAVAIAVMAQIILP